MRRRYAAGALSTAVLACLLIGAPGAVAGSGTGSTAPAAAGAWLAGDFHVHTTYSHDSYGGPHDDNTDPLEDPPRSFSDLITAGHPVLSQFAVAASRGLDFTAITDHNDVRSQSDSGWGRADELGIIPVPGYENSLDGHAQMLGATKLYDNGDQSPAAVGAIAEQLRTDGGVFQINHPTDGKGRYPDNMGWGYGFDVVPDTVEVWNITRLWQKPMPSSNSADDATVYWQEWLDRGYHVAATGGSDTHWLTTTAAQGVGQPTTWVYASENSAEGILEGLRQGRTFISHQPPAYGGPQIFLEADADRDGTYESMVGDTVPTQTPLRARVVGAPGSMLRVVTNGGGEAFAPVPVTNASFTYEFALPGGTWVRAEAFEPDAREQRRNLCDQPFGDDTTYCRNQIGVLAMTSALYLSDEDLTSRPFPTKIEFTSASATAGQYSDDARFEVVLTTEDGRPVAGHEIDFELAGAEPRTFSAVTDGTGLATRTVTLDSAPGAYELWASFGGFEGELQPASASTAFALEQEDTDLGLSVTGRGAQRALTAMLTDRDSDAGIAARDIEFWVDDTSICVTTTDDRGVARCSVPPRYAGGRHDYSAVFAGDSYYLSSSASTPS
ncbi:MAG TPA: CehA/McbA family metallohydrolase [Actinomycetota bacterium]|nr:CehA/McbA family metallohydrolase [Actinomycetota bacterium]